MSGYPEALMIKPMKIWELPDNRAHELKKHCESGEYFAERKIDGFWFEYERTEHYGYLFSRTTSAKDGLLVEKAGHIPHITDHLFNVLPPDTIVIGEVYKPNGTSKDVTTVMGCLQEKALERQEEDSNKLHYFIHDIIRYNGIDLTSVKAIVRAKIVVAIMTKCCNRFIDLPVILEAKDCNILDEYQKIIQAGGEGIVLKKCDAPYIPDKRPAWSSIKVKKHGDADVVITGFVEPTKYYDGKLESDWPYWVVETLDTSDFENMVKSTRVPENSQPEKVNETDRIVPVTKAWYYDWYIGFKIGAYDDEGNLIELGTVSSGLTDKIREDAAKNPENYLYKVIKLSYMEKDCGERTFRHPVFTEFRDDKNNYDCKISEIFS